jgi:hypothetical protein
MRNFFHGFSLEDQAKLVWTRAKEGRELARMRFRASAAVRLEELAHFHNEKHPVLTRIAHDAARDIDLMLRNHLSSEAV